MTHSGRLKYFWILTALMCALQWIACSISAPTQSGSYKMLYDWQSSTLHPEYVLYHHTNDSSTLWFRVMTDELLYARTASDAPFMAKFKLSCKSYDVSGNLKDTTSILINDPARQKGRWLLGKLVMKMDTGIYNLIVECTDIKRSSSSLAFIKADKRSSFTAQNYLVTDAHTDEPLFGEFAAENQVVKILSERNTGSKDFYVGQYTGELKLPPPPFSSSTPELPDITKTNSEFFDTDSTGNHLFLATEGLYYFTFDPKRQTGAILSASNEFYPAIKSAGQLIAPLRFITTKSEFEEIRDNYYPKKKIDDFWIECAGSKDRARELIRIYYNRVQEANYFFSTYTEGWRTDRGMIHIVFGNPSRIIKQQTYETWIYGEEGQSTTLTFVFKKQELPNMNNVYVLSRDPAFKTYWERQVTNWRNGRIYSE